MLRVAPSRLIQLRSRRAKFYGSVKKILSVTVDLSNVNPLWQSMYPARQNDSFDKAGFLE